MNGNYKAILLIAFAGVSQNIFACGFPTSAHCNLKIEHTSWNPAFNASPNTFNAVSVNPTELSGKCYNQQTQNQKCIDDVKANLTSGLNIIQLIKDSAIQAGVCEEANYAVYAGAGTNAKVNISSNPNLKLGGTWHPSVAAVPASCPAGYSFPGPVGPYCVIDITPITIDDVIEGNTTQTNARVATSTGNTSSVANASARKRLSCAAGYILSDAGYKPGKVCRKQTSAYPGSPAVAAHCTSSSNN
jgi:hypothetical protein